MDTWESVYKFSKHSGNIHKCYDFYIYSVLNVFRRPCIGATI